MSTTVPTSPFGVAEPIVTVGDWTVCPLTLTQEKINGLWVMLQRYKTLFSDLTRGDTDNFVRTLGARSTMWFEVRKHGVIVGIIWFGDMWQVTDCTGHMVFFDRAPAEKLELCKAVVRWMFDNFPLQRMTVMPPEIYWAIGRLLPRLGFRREGCKREAILIGGKWVNQLIFGITRSEAEVL